MTPAAPRRCEDGLAGRRVSRGLARPARRRLFRARRRRLAGLRAVGLGGLGAVLVLLLYGEEDDSEHRPDEEHDRDENEEPEPVPGKVRVAAREVEGREDREGDQEPGEYAEPDFPRIRDRQQHAPEPNRTTRGRAGPSSARDPSVATSSARRVPCGPTRRRPGPLEWIRFAKAIPCSKLTPGRTAASAWATPSNVLWSSFITITCQGASSPPGDRRSSACGRAFRWRGSSAGRYQRCALGFRECCPTNGSIATRASRSRWGRTSARGRSLWLSALPEHAPLARAIARCAYERGARYVDVDYTDQHVRRARIEHAPDDTLDWTPPWVLEKLDYLAERAAAR